ncbi:MAG: NupC/NupG family nucleoside CNT transporter [Deltaproteobacteria bacterium]|nr:NupC/NupG family nucleoside CNT transporter [Deltaproteobacteria bacterium]
MGTRGVAVAGAVVFLGLCFAASRDVRSVRPRTLLAGVGLQLLLALFILKTDLGAAAFSALGDGVRRFLDFTDAGSRFVFGALAEPAAMEQAFGAGRGFVFAFRALPTIVFVSAFFAVLYYLGVLQWVVRGMARGMMVLMRLSGAESLSGAANIFMGQTEAPLIIKPYVSSLTESELLAVMIGGFGTMSAGIMAVYIDMGVGAKMLLAASVMAAPASLVVSKILMPEREEPRTAGKVDVSVERSEANVVDALSQGAADGMKLAINVAAMLIAFLALIAMVDYLLAFAGTSLAGVFGWIFAPLAFLCGVGPGDMGPVADLLGTKLVANEFVAYVNLTGKYAAVLSPRSAAIATVALCGFANFGSLGIQIGGIGGIAPARRGDLARLGGRALLGGFLVTLYNAAVIGVLLD